MFRCVEVNQDAQDDCVSFMFASIRMRLCNHFTHGITEMRHTHCMHFSYAEPSLCNELRSGRITMEYKFNRKAVHHMLERLTGHTHTACAVAGTSMGTW